MKLPLVRWIWIPLYLMAGFTEFCAKINASKNVVPFKGVLLALDPGETTGWAVFDALPGVMALRTCGQIKTWPLEDALDSFGMLFNEHRPIFLVHELYRVYEWVATTHSWSDVPTLQIIGCMKTLALQMNPRLPVHGQTAQIAKNFCTDALLQKFDMYPSGQRHARDAIRHGMYFLLFGI